MIKVFFFPNDSCKINKIAWRVGSFVVLVGIFEADLKKKLSTRYVDNSDVVALIDGRGGVLDMLDEELTKPTSVGSFGERLGPRPRPLCSEINTLVTVALPETHILCL